MRSPGILQTTCIAVNVTLPAECLIICEAAQALGNAGLVATACSLARARILIGSYRALEMELHCVGLLKTLFTTLKVMP